MELLKLVRRRSFLSEVVYTVLNIALAVTVTLVVYYTGSAWLGIALVLLSKWRVLAVRPRYWYANILSNLVDIVVSLSYVILVYGAVVSGLSESSLFVVLSVMTILYSAWLLVLKPRSKRAYVVAQAGVALFFGTWALFALTYNWPVSLVVLGMWGLGFISMRHMLSAYDEETHTLTLSLVWGLIVAEIGWVAYHWAIAYALPFTDDTLLLPQVSIIVLLAAFVVYKAYDSFTHHSKVRTIDILLPLLLAVSTTLVLLLFRNSIAAI